MKRVALFLRGGVAPEWSTANVPAIRGLVQRLSEQFDITVYRTNGSDGYDTPFLCRNALVKFVPSREDDHIVKVVTRLIRLFRKDHHSKPFSLVHGLWALPGGLAAVAAGKLTGLPSIVTVLGGEAANLPEIGYGNMTSTAARGVTLWTCREARALTLLTLYQLNELRRFNFNRTQGVRIIPFGADESLFEYPNKRNPPPPYNFLHIGHVNKVKDQVTLLRAFQQIGEHIDCRLRIVGEDTLNGSLQQRARKLGIADRVTFTGLVPNEELRYHFAWSHMLLHSSLYEGQGVVFAEAAASGVPICGTRVGLLSDLGDSHAVTVAPGNHVALAQGVLDLLSDTARMEKLRTQARVWALEHTADWTAHQFAELYNQQLPIHENPDDQERRTRRWKPSSVHEGMHVR